MLAITRKVGERFKIGDDVWVSVLEICGPRVRIGIVAPREIEILREELIDRKKGVKDESESRA